MQPTDYAFLVLAAAAIGFCVGLKFGGRCAADASISELQSIWWQRELIDAEARKKKAMVK